MNYLNSFFLYLHIQSIIYIFTTNEHALLIQYQQLLFNNSSYIFTTKHFKNFTWIENI